MRSGKIFSLIAGAALALSTLVLPGCATQNEGNLDPLMLVLMPKLKVLDFDAKTYQDAAAACNATAANDYNAAMAICSNPQGFVDGVNSSGAGVLVPASAAASAVKGITLLCTTRGFTSSQPATITQTTCPSAAAQAHADALLR
jgi:hypothetical protein